MLKRNDVERTGRIKATENLILKTSPRFVLEIGAGDYSFDYLKTNLNPDIIWRKLDFAPPADIITDINKPIVELPLTDKSHDLIIITEVLEHLLWPQAILTECHRVLCEGGAIIGSVPNIVSLSYRIKWFFGGLPSCASMANMPSGISLTTYSDDKETIAGHVIDFNKQKLKELLKHTSFSKIKFYKTGLYWGRNILPAAITPVNLGSNLLFFAKKQ